MLIRDGVIAAVGRVDRRAPRSSTRSGCLVLPGGVDVHTHIFGAVAADTRSALCGGTTTALAFVDAEPGERPAEAAARTIADELPSAHIDVALHAVIWEPRAYRPGDMRAVAELGVGSVKLWLAYVELGIMADDDVAFAVMQEAAALGMVVLAHCENGRVVDVLTRGLVAAGHLGLESLPRQPPGRPRGRVRESVPGHGRARGGHALRRARDRAAARSRRSPPPASAARPCMPRPARTTCSSTSPTIAAQTRCAT